MAKREVKIEDVQQWEGQLFSIILDMRSVQREMTQKGVESFAANTATLERHIAGVETFWERVEFDLSRSTRKDSKSVEQQLEELAKLRERRKEEKDASP